MHLYCYACKMAARLKRMGHPDYQLDDPFEPRFLKHRLVIPFRWKKPRMIFVDSMGDLFDEHILETDIIRVIDVIKRNPDHIFQVLTKQVQRASDVLDGFTLPDNLWMGITQDGKTTSPDDIKFLRNLDYIPHKFVSFEPLLGEICANLAGIDWVIIGAQTGSGAQPTMHSWVADIIREAQSWDISIFLKNNLSECWHSLEVPNMRERWQQFPEAMAK